VVDADAPDLEASALWLREIRGYARRRKWSPVDLRTE
jgi:hypothetical protein